MPKKYAIKIGGANERERERERERESKRLRRFVINFFLILSLILQNFLFLVNPVYAATSPWAQTNWVGGSGQTSWSDATKFSESSNLTYSTSGQLTLVNTEKFTNTGFEADLSSWDTRTQPDSISGLQFWIKADAITGLSDGDAAGTLIDSSGNNYNAT